MASSGAASGEGCSEPPGRFECTLVDPIRDATVTIAVPRQVGRAPTLGEVLSSYRAADREVTAASRRGDPGSDLERRRFADGLFLLTDDRALGELIPGLRFRIGGRTCGLDHRLD